MKLTLKNGHAKRRLIRLEEKLARVDKEILKETRLVERVDILIEAMNEEDLEKVSGIIDKLRSIQQNAQSSTELSGVINKVLMDLQKITGGEQSIGQKAKGLFWQGKGNHSKIFKDAMGLVSALETGFRLMPQLLKNMLGAMNSKSGAAQKTVSSLLIGEGFLREAPGDESPTITTEPVNGQKAQDTSKGADKLELLQQNIVKAMKPSKWFGLASGKIPYVDDAGALVRDILDSVPVGILMKVIRTITGGPQATNLAQDVAQSDGEGGSGETAGSEGSQGASPGTNSSEQGSEESNGTSAAGSQEKPASFSLNAQRAMITGLQKELPDVDLEIIKTIINKLAVANKLREGQTLNSKPAITLLKLLAKSGKLTEAVKYGIVKLQLSNSDIKDLIGK